MERLLNHTPPLPRRRSVDTAPACTAPCTARLHGPRPHGPHASPALHGEAVLEKPYACTLLTTAAAFLCCITAPALLCRLLPRGLHMKSSLKGLAPASQTPPPIHRTRAFLEPRCFHDCSAALTALHLFGMNTPLDGALSQNTSRCKYNHNAPTIARQSQSPLSACGTSALRTWRLCSARGAPALRVWRLRTPRVESPLSACTPKWFLNTWKS